MDDIKRLERANASIKKYVLPSMTKPCVAELLSEKSDSGTNKKAFVIAVELKRTGNVRDEALLKIKEWNLSNYKQLSPRELESTVNSAFSREYQHGCTNYLAEYCNVQDKNMCKFYRELKKNAKQEHPGVAFIKNGWTKELGNVAKLIYYMAIPVIEYRQGIKPGSIVFATYKHINEITGISSASTKKGLQKLEEVGLIKLKIGTSRRWEKKATEITRVIPVPKPKSLF